MPKPKKDRTVLFPPRVVLFKPQGIPAYMLEQVVLMVDEYEAVRLVDNDGLDQEKAAEKMNVSRPTCARIIESAHKKIAEALTQGKAIRIEGGAYILRRNLLKCLSCGTLWEEKTPQRDSDEADRLKCPSCEGNQVLDLSRQVGGQPEGGRGGGKGRSGRMGRGWR